MNRTMKAAPPADDQRTEARIREHYEVERELAQRLREADRASRRTLYNDVYDELYRRVPDHPLIARAAEPAAREPQIRKLTGWVAPFLGRDGTFLEIGPGDCLFSFALAGRCKFVYAVDVSDGYVDAARKPANFALTISDGTSVPVPAASIDVAFSDQLMEHLHPDDALEQLAEIQRALKPGGTYIVITPNRFSGPHDVSRFFSDRAEGFHLREYTNRELAAILRRAGFASVRAGVPLRGRLATLPVGPFAVMEAILGALPAALRTAVARTRPVRALLGVRLIATK